MAALVERIFNKAVSDLIRRGSLEIVFPSGNRQRFGDGSGETVVASFRDKGAIWGFLIDPELRLGEAIMDARLVVERGSLYDFLDLLLSNIQQRNREQGAASHNVFTALGNWFRTATRGLRQRNSLQRARSNVASHYDLGNALYALFLDADWQYSCAYFEHPGQSLEEAQLAKKRHLAAKLMADPGNRILDIGCGWGGLGLYLSEIAQAAQVVGVTLSEEQLATARRRASERGLAEKIDFRLQDYRKLDETFDRIISVGMFEHVGLPYYDAFFAQAARLLKPEGVMMLHTIGCTGTPSQANPWLDRYIFPGGYLPTLSELTPALERSGLVICDLEVLRLHYAETLREWRHRFLANREKAAAMYDERFCRMWEFYLAFCEVAFRYEDVVVYQLQLAKRNDRVPLTRDYIAEREAMLRTREASIYSETTPQSAVAA